MQDFAQQMQWLVDVAYPDVEVVRVVLDNLNTHKPASLYETFPPAEARRILKKLRFHYTPKHGSWLNMRAGSEGWNFAPLRCAVLPKTAEIELSVLSRQCLSRRIGDEATLKQQVDAYKHRRNGSKATIQWRFTSHDARAKLKYLYPSIPD